MNAALLRHLVKLFSTGLRWFRASLNVDDLIALFATRRRPYGAIRLNTYAIASERNAMVLLGINRLVGSGPLRGFALTVCVQHCWTACDACHYVSDHKSSYRPNPQHCSDRRRGCRQQRIVMVRCKTCLFPFYPRGEPRAPGRRLRHCAPLPPFSDDLTTPRTRWRFSKRCRLGGNRYISRSSVDGIDVCEDVTAPYRTPIRSR
jgi:hypothetical protein